MEEDEPEPQAAPTFAVIRAYGTWNYGLVTSNAGQQAWMVQGAYVAPTDDSE